MREVVFDTETTGLDPAVGHRLVEFGCVELENHVPTGRTLQGYVNPGRPMPSEAFAIHGLSDEFLAGFPPFADAVDKLLEFLGESPLVIHNADFDMRFLNWELSLLGRPGLPASRAIDTVGLARRRFPGAPASLKALCQRFGIDDSARDLHGALLDARLLADVYLELVGGREPGLALAATRRTAAATAAGERPPRPPRPHAPSEAERAAHAAFVADLARQLKEGQPIWLAD